MSDKRTCGNCKWWRRTMLRWYRGKCFKDDEVTGGYHEGCTLWQPRETERTEEDVQTA